MKSFKTLAIIAMVFGLSACTQIDTNNVGVESALGQVKQESLPPGVYFTAFKTIDEICGTEIPLAINDMKPQTSDKITLSDLDIDIYLQIDVSKAAILRKKWSGDMSQVEGEGCKRLGMNFVTRQAREAIYDVSSRIGSSTIHTERTRIAAEAVLQLQKNLDKEAGKGLFNIISANVKNLITDPALEANIKAAAQQQFKLAEEENRKKVAVVEADRKRIEAQGEADSIQIKAAAVSKQGGAEFVQLEAIKKWDGKLPTTSAGVVPFINLK